MTERKLLPCPFCGGAANFRPYKRDGLTLECATLGCVVFNQRVLRHSLDWLRERMVESWNTRTPQCGESDQGTASGPEAPSDADKHCRLCGEQCDSLAAGLCFGCQP